jgi:hypothetical protein
MGVGVTVVAADHNRHPRALLLSWLSCIASFEVLLAARPAQNQTRHKPILISESPREGGGGVEGAGRGKEGEGGGGREGSKGGCKRGRRSEGRREEGGWQGGAKSQKIHQQATEFWVFIAACPIFVFCKRPVALVRVVTCAYKKRASILWRLRGY